MQILTKSILHGDNQAANHIAQGRGSWRTRALTTKVNAIKSRTDRGLLNLVYEETSKMRADGLTKSKGPDHARAVRIHFGLEPV